MKKSAFIEIQAALCLIFMMFMTAASPAYSQTLRSSEERIPTEKWAVRLNPGQNPDELAKETGAENLGQIGKLPDTYLFRFPGTLTRSASLNIEFRLKKEKRVKWHQQQIARWRFPRQTDAGAEKILRSAQNDMLTAQNDKLTAQNDNLTAQNDNLTAQNDNLKSNRSLRSSISDLSFSDPSLLEQWHLENTGQSGGIAGEDVNVAGVWEKGITGKGIVIGVVDDGLQYQHPDIALNYRADLSYDFNDDDNDPAPNLSSWYEDDHGTSAAGVAAARDDYTCGRGVAYRAGLSGLRLISAANTDAEEAQCLSYKRDNIHIYTNSWGPDDDGKTLEGPEPLTADVLEDSIRNGRSGLGTIYVWAAGNGKRSSDNVNYDGYANSRFTIAVGAADHKGIQASYSEPGAAMLVTAPSDGDGADITTTDLLGDDGGSSGDCRSDFGGTSASAPMAAGVVALMLEANPNLTWRDVQHILVQSAVKNHSSDADWTLNAAGFHINHKYGFGRIDADAAVKSASSWQRVPEATDLSYGPETVNQSIPDNNPAGIVSAIHVDRDMKLEHAEVVLNATHRYRGSLKVVLTSPSGTQSILAESRSDRNADYDGWKFMTVRNWGEGSVGEWKLTVADTVLSNTGTFDSWELILHGTAEAVNHPPVLKSDTAETNKDTAVTVSVLANDSDADGDALTVTSLSNPAHGSVAANADNTVTYTPETGFAGEDRFTYSAKDKAVSSTADVTVLVGKVREIYSAEPQAPIPDGNATGLSSGIRINAAGLIKDVNVTLNIRHPSLADMEAALISPKGTRAVMVRNISGKDMTGTTLDDEARQALSEGSAPFQAAYRPSEILSSFAGEFLIGEWKLQVTDTAENTIEGILESWQLEVCYFPLWENYPPAAVNDAAATKKDTPVIIPVLDNDRDPNGDTLTVTDLSVLPARGSVKADSDSRLQYTPESGFTGTDSFVYIVSDGQGKTAAATVSVTVFALENVIPGLRVLSGQTPELADGIADINNNHKLDMPDVIFILIKLSER